MMRFSAKLWWNALRWRGFACDWYDNGTSALRALKKARHSIVISDIHLPDITGEALYRKLLDAEKALPPFIFITGFGTVDQAVRLLKLGAEDYITSPSRWRYCWKRCLLFANGKRHRLQTPYFSAVHTK